MPLPTEQERAALDRSLLSADAATRSAAIVAFAEVLDTPIRLLAGLACHARTEDHRGDEGRRRDS